MSERDWLSYGDAAKRFSGHRVRLGVAANSLNLGLEPVGSKRRYIWIDPPWSLGHRDRPIVNSDDAPHPEATDHSVAFKEFCDQLAVLNDAKLKDVRHAGGGTTEFLFEGGLRLVARHDEVDDGDDLWYDDWYATCEEK